MDCEMLIDRKGNFVPKEIAWIHCKKPLDLSHYLLKTPNCYMNNRNKHIVQNCFNVSIKRGDAYMMDVVHGVKPYNYIYVQGAEKARMLQGYFPFNKIIDIQSKSLHDMEDPCKHIHCPIGLHSTTHCAVKKVYKMYHLLFM